MGTMSYMDFYWGMGTIDEIIKRNVDLRLFSKEDIELALKYKARNASPNKVIGVYQSWSDNGKIDTLAQHIQDISSSKISLVLRRFFKLYEDNDPSMIAIIHTSELHEFKNPFNRIRVTRSVPDFRRKDTTAILSEYTDCSQPREGARLSTNLFRGVSTS